MTRLKGNMKNKLMPLIDKLLLRKRALIETVNDQLKNSSQIEHTRHRSVWNFRVNMLGALAAYCLQPKKPFTLRDGRCAASSGRTVIFFVVYREPRHNTPGLFVTPLHFCYKLRRRLRQKPI